MQRSMGSVLIAWVGLIVIILVVGGCVFDSNAAPLFKAPSGSTSDQAVALQAPAVQQFNARPFGSEVALPTPDSPHSIPTRQSETQEYIVQPGDTLNVIAGRYGVSSNAIASASNLTDINLLEVGQVLVIPPPEPVSEVSAFKIIPDSELVMGPAFQDFDVAGFVDAMGGYLATHEEDVYGEWLTGAQVVQRVAREYSVGPRILLALLEYRSGWVSQKNPAPEFADYPLGIIDNNRKGLYLQLSYAANQLNRGFYLWRVNAVSTWLMGDGSAVPVDATINAGTAGVQQLMATINDRTGWQAAVSDQGIYLTFFKLFGFPFDYAVEPFPPAGLAQPTLQLPFEDGTTWAYTGGPHGGWGDGSAWAALDFAPPGEALGCVSSDSWVVAAADGLITYSSGGAVVQDLDGDGYEGTGWTLLYMHIETRDRVAVGQYLQAGERIGHPSCEGGYSTGTHVHFARRYNGEWIPADGNMPFVLDGYASSGDGYEYNGYLTDRDGAVIEAWEGRSEINAISR